MTPVPSRPATPTVYRGVEMRSYSEAKVAAGIDFIGWKWVYEPERFTFDYNGGRWSYLPDFLVIDEDDRFYLEVKPSIDAFDLNRVRAFAEWQDGDVAVAVVPLSWSRTGQLYSSHGDLINRMWPLADPRNMELAIPYRQWATKKRELVHQLTGMTSRCDVTVDQRMAASTQLPLHNEARPPAPSALSVEYEWATRNSAGFEPPLYGRMPGCGCRWITV